MYDDNEDEDSYESDDDDSHQLTSLDTGTYPSNIINYKIVSLIKFSFPIPSIIIG